jgi:hypothetical protein
MTKLNNKTVNAGLLLHLVTLGTVAALIITLFGSATFSVLTNNKALLVARAIEGKPPDSATVVDINIATISAEAEPVVTEAAVPPEAENPPHLDPGEEAEAKLVPVPQEPTTATPETTASMSPVSTEAGVSPKPENMRSDPSEDVAAKPAPVLHEATTATPESMRGFETEDQSAGPQKSATILLRIGAALNGAPPISERTTQAAPNSDKEHDPTFHAVQVKHSQSIQPDHANVASHVTPPPEQIRKRHYNDRSAGADAAYRVKKECGPITDRALRLSCIGSFRGQPK